VLAGNVWPGLRHDWQLAIIEPRRHFTSDTGGSVCTWYFDPLYWRTTADARACLAKFFDTYSLIANDVRVKAKANADDVNADGEASGTASTALLVCTRGDAVPLKVAKLLPRRKHDGYFLRSVQRNMGIAAPRKLRSSTTMRSKWASGPLLWSIVFMRSDVLWLALCAPSALRADFAQLWHYHHVRNARGRRFKDAVSDVFVEAVCGAHVDADVDADGQRTRVRGAASWSTGAAMEMVFRNDDAAARRLVSRLDRALAGTDAKVARLKTWKRVTVLARYDMDADALTVSRVLLVSGERDLVVAEPPEDLRSDAIRYNHVRTWSEPLIRGILFTLTQLALVTQIGDAETRNAMAALSHAASRSKVNCYDLHVCKREDAREIRAHMKDGRELTGR
jgi:hypothetical protein